MKPKVAVHKFSSCDGCQLAFLNLGEALIELVALVDLVHFPEAGPIAADEDVTIAFVEGSVSSPDDLARLQDIRAHSRYLVTLGACATAGGIQALRNLADANASVKGIYAHPEYIKSLATSTPIAKHVKVDLELWGCPVDSRQVVGALRALLSGVMPREDQDKVCLECKRRLAVCVMVAHGKPCLGPVTRTGCGALCPAFGRDCYGCYGPAENVNTPALSRRFAGLGLVPDAIARRFHAINSGAPEFHAAGLAAQAHAHE